MALVDSNGLGYLRYPTINGDDIAFVCEDDLWLASADGGRAAGPGSDAAPAASRPSGSAIVAARSAYSGSIQPIRGTFDLSCTSKAIWIRRAGLAIGSISFPITRASATFIRSRSTARTWR